MTSERRLQVAELTSQGYGPAEISKQLGYSSASSVTSALYNKDVKEQIKWHRDNMFEQARIDRVQLLRDLYESVTCPTGPIFQTLRGEGDILLASNIEKLDDVQSKLIQAIEVEPTEVIINGVKSTVSIVKKLRFHSPDAARKILSKAAGFEDGTKVDMDEVAGPFRGLTIIPPTETVAPEDPNPVQD